MPITDWDQKLKIITSSNIEWGQNIGGQALAID